MIDTPSNLLSGRAITWRSVLFGLLGIFLVAAGAGYHDGVCRGVLAIGNHMPGGPFTYMMLVGLAWNGLMSTSRFTRERLALCPKELSVVLMMTLVASFAPTSGLFRYFHRALTYPWKLVIECPDWVEQNVLGILNPAIFPSPAPHVDAMGVLQIDDLVYNGFFMGLASGASLLPWGQVPWGAWVKCVAYWGPLVMLCSVCVVAVQLVVHRQWADHEQLGYPVAQVASSFCARRDGRRGVPDIFRTGLFWYGMVPVLLFYVLQYLSRAFPLSVPPMHDILPNLKNWNVDAGASFPLIWKSSVAWSCQGQSLLFTVVGLAYFVSSEISLTMGLANFLLLFAELAFFGFTGTQIIESESVACRAGSFVGYTLILLYTGRAYFRAVFSRALGIRRGAQRDGTDVGRSDPAVMAARVLLVSFVGFVAVLVLMGCDWLQAVFFALLTLMMFFILARVVCETGIPFVQCNWAPSRLLATLFGPAMVGPSSLALLQLVHIVISQDARECLAPYAATSLKVASDNGMKLRRVFWILVGAVGLAIVFAYFATGRSLYSVGGAGDGWASYNAPHMQFDYLARRFYEMKETHEYAESAAAGGFGLLRLMRPDGDALRFFLAGAALVIGFSSLRFRFSKFPIHPVVFLLWGTMPSQSSWYSFLVGWAIKALIVRFGGGSVYQRLKPLFIGVIAGELLAVGLHVIANVVYLAATGNPSPYTVSILPL